MKLRVRLGTIGLAASLMSLNASLIETAIAQPRSSQPATNQSANISTPQIRQILDQIMLAARKRDANTVIKYLAPNAVVDLTVQSPLGDRKLTLNREQYRQYLQQGFEIAQDYTSQLSNLNVQVDASGKRAIATYTLVETVTISQPAVNVASTTDASVQFERVGGQILAIGIKSVSKVDAKLNRD